MGYPGTFATLQQSNGFGDVVNLSMAKIQRTGVARIGNMNNPDRYTNIVFYLGDQGQSIEFSGTWVPNQTSVGSALSPFSFPNNGDAWVTSSGADPIPTIEFWERTGTSLTYNDETGTITSCNVSSFGYKLTPGIPLVNIIYYELKLKESLQ